MNAQLWIALCHNGEMVVFMIFRYITFIVGELILGGRCTAENDFEIEEEADFSIILVTANKLYKY